MTDLRIGDRVRSVTSRNIGTVFSTEYQFGGVTKVAVIWDEVFGVWSQPIGNLVLITYTPTVGPEARPVSVGALYHPGSPAALADRRGRV